jgi:two-component system cell cycle response regulator CtrA
MRILLVEDDLATSRSLELMLTGVGMTPYTTGSGEEALELARLYDYDLIVLDLGLPDMTGAEVMRRLRQSKVQTPVLVLSGDDAAESKLKSFGLGADDYLTKPFQRAELVARIQAIVRRSRGHAQSVVQFGRLSVNLDAKVATVEGKDVGLTRKEYQMLELMALRRGATMTKEMFLSHLYGGMDEPEAKIVDVFICKLRKKLAAALGHDSPIETVWGRGYVLRDPERGNQPARELACA